MATFFFTFFLSSGSDSSSHFSYSAPPLFFAYFQSHSAASQKPLKTPPYSLDVALMFCSQAWPPSPPYVIQPQLFWPLLISIIIKEQKQNSQICRFLQKNGDVRKYSAVDCNFYRIIILKYMQSIFVVRQIVWAKVKGYPWWPAEIAKLPTPDNNLFKVVFIAEDTHAFLNPRDVRKYAQFYDQCSKKKMRGLAPAIQNADEIFKKRAENITKVSNQCSKQEASPRKSKNKNPAKTKNIRKGGIRGQKNKQSESSEHQYAIQQVLQQPQQIRPILNFTKATKAKQQTILPQRNNPQMQSQEMERSSKSDSESESMQQEKFLNQSEQKADRSKIDTVQELIYKHIQEIKHSNYQFSIDHYRLININNLTDEELLQSKITNMLSFIIYSLKKQFNLQQNSKEKDTHFAKEKEELRQLIAMQKQLKQRILNYLNDTSYYDQYLKLIQKNKKNRNDYENRLIFYLKNSYKIKKELALIFASRLMAEINNGTINKEKQLLQDIKERRMEITNINNKAAIDRNIENMIPKYM